MIKEELQISQIKELVRSVTTEISNNPDIGVEELVKKIFPKGNFSSAKELILSLKGDWDKIRKVICLLRDSGLPMPIKGNKLLVAGRKKEELVIFLEEIKDFLIKIEEVENLTKEMDKLLAKTFKRV